MLAERRVPDGFRAGLIAVGLALSFVGGGVALADGVETGFGFCGEQTAGSCCEPNGTPFCDDAPCCEAVCAVDSFCCESDWDEVCAGLAGGICDACADISGACCLPNDNSEFFCALRTEDECVSSGGIFRGVGLSCDDVSCECAGDLNSDLMTDALDLGILLGAFGTSDVGDLNRDGVTDALDLGIVLGDFGCGEEIEFSCGEAEAGSCCAANGSAFCDDAACCELICASDPFCCATDWDETCAEAAIVACTVCAPPVGACCLAGEALLGGFCDEISEAECVAQGGEYLGDGTTCDGDPCAEPAGACCLLDGTCLEGSVEDECVAFGGVYQGDGTLCDEVACPIVVGCGAPDAGECCEPNGSPFCDDAACCSAVCASDSFCCDVEWDEVCAVAAFQACNICSGGG